MISFPFSAFLLFQEQFKHRFDVTHLFPQKKETHPFSFQKKSRQQQPGLAEGQTFHLSCAWRTCPLVRQNLPKFQLCPAGSSAGLWFALCRVHSNASFKSFLISHQQLCNFQPSRQSRQVTRAGEVLWAQGHWRERKAFLLRWEWYFYHFSRL